MQDQTTSEFFPIGLFEEWILDLLDQSNQSASIVPNPLLQPLSPTPQFPTKKTFQSLSRQGLPLTDGAVTLRAGD
ncbi:MAG: hypothetical protein DWI25_08535 [Planctomycetota bacterium]|nr:MAG: hypothetical protein DWI25_08535 [Planctomycetota bacterium]